MISVLFVCLGNICRSPMAEAIFKHLLQQEGLDKKVQVDSAGIGGWHEGNPPHKGTSEILLKNGISTEGLSARQLTANDLKHFDLIVVMDKKNYRSVKKLAGKNRGQIHMLMDFVGDESSSEVPDPFYSGRFEEAYNLIDKGCRELLMIVRKMCELK